MLSTQVSERVEYYSNKSVHKFAVDSGIITSSTIRILLQALRMFLYKINFKTLYQFELKEKRDNFANTTLKMIDRSHFDVGRIWFTDGAHFHQDDVINRHNLRISMYRKPIFVSHTTAPLPET